MEGQVRCRGHKVMQMSTGILGTSPPVCGTSEGQALAKSCLPGFGDVDALFALVPALTVKVEAFLGRQTHCCQFSMETLIYLISSVRPTFIYREENKVGILSHTKYKQISG